MKNTLGIFLIPLLAILWSGCGPTPSPEQNTPDISQEEIQSVEQTLGMDLSSRTHSNCLIDAYHWANACDWLPEAHPDEWDDTEDCLDDVRSSLMECISGKASAKTGKVNCRPRLVKR